MKQATNRFIFTIKIRTPKGNGGSKDEPIISVDLPLLMACLFDRDISSTYIFMYQIV